MGIELFFERLFSAIKDCFIFLSVVAVLIGAYLLLTSEKVSAMSLKTILTSRPDIIEILQERRGYNTREIAEYIATHEGFSHVPFSDPSGIGKVIGFGFQPRGRTYMTKREGVAILEAEVKRLIKKVVLVYGHVPQNKMTALVSILYNTPTYEKIVKDRELVDIFVQEDIVRAKEKLLNHSLRGIRNRRADEIALFFSEEGIKKSLNNII